VSIEFVNKEVDNEYSDLDNEAYDLEQRLAEIEERQLYLRSTYEQE
jgi:hypothetical protein